MDMNIQKFFRKSTFLCFNAKFKVLTAPADYRIRNFSPYSAVCDGVGELVRGGGKIAVPNRKGKIFREEIIRTEIDRFD